MVPPTAAPGRPGDAWSTLAPRMPAADSTASSAPPPEPGAAASSWCGLVRGVEPALRRRVAQVGLVLLLMAASVGALHYAARVGGAPRGWVWLWSALSLGGPMLAYGLVRSGWSRRLDDPSMTVPQMIYALACAAGAYALARSDVDRLLVRLAQPQGTSGANGVAEPIRFSCGLTEHIAGEAVSVALDRADRALYEAKAQGRGRVVVA